MKIASIDVGIKNLALIILTVNKESLEINYWNIINLVEEKKHTCNQFITGKKNKDDKIECGNIAKFFKNNEFFCKCHANKCNFKLPTSQLMKYKRLKLDELLNLVKDYDMEFSGIESKKNLISFIEKYISDNVLENINSDTNSNDLSLLDLGISLSKKLNELKDIIKDIDIVLIENQIGPLANRMCSLQGMITQYFILNNITNIHYISACNKLKNFLSDKKKKTTYHERKKIGIDITKNLLNLLSNIENDFFIKNKKKDDLSDCFLQAIWYIQENFLNNKLNLIYEDNKFKF